MPSSEDSPRHLAFAAFLNKLRWCELLDPENSKILSREAEELSREAGLENQVSIRDAENKVKLSASFRENAITDEVLIGKAKGGDSADDKVYKPEKAAKAVLSAGPTLFRAIRKQLGDHEIQAECFVEFDMELTCYVLHLLDRRLSDLDQVLQARGSKPVRDKLTNDLVIAICNEHHSILEEFGYKISIEDVLETFFRMYNARQQEYGVFKEDWFTKVALRFGQHAAEALEVSQERKAILGVQCAILAPAVFTDLIPYLPTQVEA